MHPTVFNDFANIYFNQCMGVLVAKGEEYSTTADKLHNFKQAAALQQISPRKALFGMLAKHMVSIADMCKDDKLYSDAQWDEKLRDNINYSVLLRAIVEDEKLELDVKVVFANQLSIPELDWEATKEKIQTNAERILKG